MFCITEKLKMKLLPCRCAPHYIVVAIVVVSRVSCGRSRWVEVVAVNGDAAAVIVVLLLLLLLWMVHEMLLLVVVVVDDAAPSKVAISTHSLKLNLFNRSQGTTEHATINDSITVLDPYFFF